MEIILKNVKKKDLQVIKSLAKALGFEIEKKEEILITLNLFNKS